MAVPWVGTAVLQAKSSQANILRVESPGLLPVSGGIFPFQDKIPIESNPQTSRMSVCKTASRPISVLRFCISEGLTQAKS